jgi:minor extracellular serine protease Vpr
MGARIGRWGVSALGRRSLALVVLVSILVTACASTPPANTDSPSPAATPAPTAGAATPTAASGTPPATPAATPTTEPTAQPASPSPGEPSPTAAPDLGATGKGVTVVVIDRGIDWRHPDFINEDGTTRIRAMLDMSGQVNWCTPPKPRPVEYSQDQINAALRGEAELPSRDAVGHGTATAGLAAGNGRALADRRYVGVAPEADLVIVKATSEGAPARGNVPAEDPFNACIDDAIDWVDDKIRELGQPAVVIWNAGTQWGPIDGSSAISRKINRVFGPDVPGRVWVATSGDEGGIPNHAGTDFGPDAPAVIPFRMTGDSSYPSAWYSGGSPARVTIELSDGTKVGPVGPGESAESNGVRIDQLQPGREFYPWQSDSGDRAVWMSIQGHRGKTGTITFAATGSGEGHLDVYGDVRGPDYLSSAIEFTDFLVPGRINDVSSTTGVIVTGVHVALEGFVSMDGRNMDFSAEGRTGELWYRSSGGPTRDGREVIDLTAAGQNVPAALAADSLWSTYAMLQPRDGEGHYIRFGGTSAAGPIVVGTIALMLEVNPTLTTEQVREILHSTAIADEFTGPVPNPDWGYGKLDIAAAVDGARAAAP